MTREEVERLREKASGSMQVCSSCFAQAWAKQLAYEKLELEPDRATVAVGNDWPSESEQFYG